MKRPTPFWPLAEVICSVSDFLTSPPTKTGKCNRAAGVRGFLHLHVRGMLVPEAPLCLTRGSVYGEALKKEGAGAAKSWTCWLLPSWVRDSAERAVMGGEGRMAAPI